MTWPRVVALSSDQVPEARALVFEYMAGTEGEKGQPVPTEVRGLPGVLRDECMDLGGTYRSPGALLIAYDAQQAIGCVGLKPLAPPGTLEVKRLYVRPTHRGLGVARSLMQHASRHAARHGFSRLVLDVMPSRTRVIDFYRGIGFVDAPPYPAESPDPMIYLRRVVTP